MAIRVPAEIILRTIWCPRSGTEIPRPLFCRTTAVRARMPTTREYAAWPNNGVQQTPRGNAIAKFQPVRDQPFHTQVPRQWTHNMVNTLAHQNHFGSGFDHCFQCAHTSRPELRFQFVLEFFFAKQIEAVTADPAQNGINNAGSKLAIRGIKNRPQQGHQKHKSAPAPPSKKGLGIPGKERHRTNGRQPQADCPRPSSTQGKPGRGSGFACLWFQVLNSSRVRAKRNAPAAGTCRNSSRQVPVT